MKLFFDPSGPLLRYRDGALQIEDLNPETKLHWQMTRGEMLVLGIRCLWAAIVGSERQARAARGRRG